MRVLCVQGADSSATPSALGWQRCRQLLGLEQAIVTCILMGLVLRGALQRGEEKWDLASGAGTITPDISHPPDPACVPWPLDSPCQLCHGAASQGGGLMTEGIGSPQGLPAQLQPCKVTTVGPSCACAGLAHPSSVTEAGSARRRALLWPRLQAALAQPVVWCKEGAASHDHLGCPLGAEGYAWLGLG